MRGEKFVQTAVSTAKSTIVVKSVIVPVFNALSTMKQLVMNGVSPRTIAREYPTKLVEIEQHLKNLDRTVEINALMTAHRKDKARLAQLEAELTAIEESSKRMSIWPLIEAGEFMSISEGMTEADVALTEGRFAEYVANLLERIPQKLGVRSSRSSSPDDTSVSGTTPDTPLTHKQGTRSGRQRARSVMGSTSSVSVPAPTLALIDQDLANVAPIRELACAHFAIIRLPPFQVAQEWPEPHELLHALCGPVTCSRSTLCTVEIGDPHGNAGDLDGICVSDMRHRA